MLRILYNDIYTAKTSIFLFILILLVPYINMLIKIPIFMILVINSIRLVTYSDYKNRTTIFYTTLPITRKEYIIEKAVFLISTMIVGVIILLVPLLTNQHGDNTLYVSLLIYICGITLLISGIYLLISYVFNPITADFYNEIAALGISLVLGKILIFDRSDIFTIITKINGIAPLFLVLSFFIFSCIIFFTCKLFKNKNL